MKSEKEKALEIAQLMEDGKGKDVTVIDVSQLNSWTDYFVIVTGNHAICRFALCVAKKMLLPMSRKQTKGKLSGTQRGGQGMAAGWRLGGNL